jgi:hypothetical protein
MKENTKHLWDWVLILPAVMGLVLFVGLVNPWISRPVHDLLPVLSPIGALLVLIALVYFIQRQTARFKALAVTLNLLALPFWGLMVFMTFWFWDACHEPPEWTSAYGQIHTGMTMEEVEKLMDPLNPESKRVRKVTGRYESSQVQDAKLRLFYRGPNAWQYRIYFNKENVVVYKDRWWD